MIIYISSSSCNSISNSLFDLDASVTIIPSVGNRKESHLFFSLDAIRFILRPPPPRFSRAAGINSIGVDSSRLALVTTRKRKETVAGIKRAPGFFHGPRNMSSQSLAACAVARSRNICRRWLSRVPYELSRERIEGAASVDRVSSSFIASAFIAFPR